MPSEMGSDLPESHEENLDIELASETKTLQENIGEYQSNIEQLEKSGARIPLNDKVKEILGRIGEYIDDEKVAMAFVGGALGTMGLIASGPQAGMEGFGIGAGLVKAFAAINPELKKAFEKSIEEKRQAREKRKQTNG